MREPLNRNEAKKLIGLIYREGSVVYSRHCFKELEADGMSTLDVENVLRAGRIMREPEEENGTYRYRVETPLMAVVVAFRSETEICIVTAWRKK